jgi:hypothetical protein
MPFASEVTKVKFSKLLMAGAAICALATAPAFAASKAPNIHLAFHGGGTLVKTSHHIGKATNFTETATFSGSISTSADYKTKVVVLGETWYDSTNCTQPTKEKWKPLPKKTTYAKLSQSTSTGSIGGCTGTVFTFHDINYDLTKKNGAGKTDTFTGDLVAKNFIGYNLKLIANLIINITS